MSTEDTNERVTRLESAFSTLTEAIGEIKDSMGLVAEATTKIAAIEERQQNSSQAMERAFKLIEENAKGIADLKDWASNHNAYSEKRVSELKNMFTAKLAEHAKDNSTEHDQIDQKIVVVEKDIATKDGIARGAWMTGSILWGGFGVILIGVVTYLSTITLKNHEQVIILTERLRVLTEQAGM